MEENFETCLKTSINKAMAIPLQNSLALLKAKVERLGNVPPPAHAVANTTAPSTATTYQRV